MLPRALVLVFSSTALFSVMPAAVAEPPPPRLEERMNETEFKAAGLDQLSSAQLDFLNRWLGSKGVETAAVPIRKRDGQVDYYPDDAARETVDSRIVGSFTGWHGRTVVTLENGQKWQQSESGSRGDVNMTNPVVIVKPMSMGSWLMVVKGCNCSIRVKRVG